MGDIRIPRDRRVWSLIYPGKNRFNYLLRFGGVAIGDGVAARGWGRTRTLASANAQDRAKTLGLDYQGEA